MFKKAIEKTKKKDASTCQWLKDNEPLEHWARFKFDPTLKSDNNTNNFVESFNNAIVKHGGRPLYTMLEEIRKIVGSRFDKCFQLASSWESKVTPYVEKKLRMVEVESRNCINIVPAGRGEFDVLEGSTNFTVRLTEHFCDCQKWQISGLPCKHAARCILRMNHSLDDYCSHWFSTEKYKNLYDAIIHPISDPCMWGDTTLPVLDPPYELRKRGRPEKHQRRESTSVIPPEGRKRFSSGTKRCKICKQMGHNKSTCGKPRDENGILLSKYKRKQKQKQKQPVGRPRKSQKLSQATEAGSSPPTQSSQAM